MFYVRVANVPSELQLYGSLNIPTMKTTGNLQNLIFPFSQPIQEIMDLQLPQ